MAYEEHISRYQSSLESLFKENDLALKELYYYLKNNSIDNSAIIKQDIYQGYYYFEVNHNIRDFDPIMKEITLDENIKIVYKDNNLTICSKTLNILKDLAEKEFKLICTIIPNE